MENFELKNTHPIISANQEKKTITFFNGNNEMIKITEGKFFFNGGEIKDVHNVYEKFNDWLGKALNVDLNK